MESLVEEAWRIYDESADLACIVRPSCPILYFGDKESFDRSALRVITVGLNASSAEFPVDNPFNRFPSARTLFPRILDDNSLCEHYLAALNNYFRCDPLWRWFSSFEPLLNGMGASYRAGHPNTAIHTDLCTPLATAPTWSKLTHERRGLEEAGVKLWLRLVRHLEPDVVLISVARAHLAKLDFPPVTEWATLYTVERANPYRVEIQEFEITPGKRTPFVFGRAAITPFGLVRNADKRKIGARVGEYVHGRR